MDWWQAVILGIVEGVTEYLPVSSTGHLLLTQRLLGITENEAANAYAICIQAGAILAVLGLYWRRVVDMLRGAGGTVGLGPGSDRGYRLLRNIVTAFLPAAVVGLLFDDLIEEVLFGLWPVVIAWFVGGLAILLVARHRARHGGQQQGLGLDALTVPAALAIGVIQCLAMWPGTSRSLVTIVGGLIVGLSLTAAVEFSFLLGVVTLLAATVYKLFDAGPIMLQTYGVTTMLIGSLIAWASAVVAVKWMVAYLKRHGMELFGYYRVILAAVVAGLLLAGVATP
jgi:undecaprenyl-diphosphatase